jgi:uncharacterized protein (DUF697 family)
MDKQAEAERIIRSHVMWAMGAGLIPVPIIDIAAVTAIQLDMIKQLAALHGSRFSVTDGKAFLSALTGSTFAAIGSSLFKIIPGVGSVLGGVSMSITSGASTYAVGQVIHGQLLATGSLDNIDINNAKRAYSEKFEEGKAYASDLEKNKDKSAEVYKSLEQLASLKEKGILTEEVFEAKKKELLARIYPRAQLPRFVAGPDDLVGAHLVGVAVENRG